MGKPDEVKFKQLKEANFQEIGGTKGNKITQIELETDLGELILFNQTQENANLINKFINNSNPNFLIITKDNRWDGIKLLVITVGSIIHLKSGEKIRIDLSIIYTGKSLFIPVTSEEIRTEAHKIARLISNFIGLKKEKFDP